jgi:hypothetical protein
MKQRDALWRRCETSICDADRDMLFFLTSLPLDVHIRPQYWVQLDNLCDIPRLNSKLVPGDLFP